MEAKQGNVAELEGRDESSNRSGYILGTMAVEYLMSIVLGRHQNVEHNTCTSIILRKYSKNTSDVLSGN